MHYRKHLSALSTTIVGTLRGIILLAVNIFLCCYEYNKNNYLKNLTSENFEKAPCVWNGWKVCFLVYISQTKFSFKAKNTSLHECKYWYQHFKNPIKEYMFCISLGTIFWTTSKVLTSRFIKKEPPRVHVWFSNSKENCRVLFLWTPYICDMCHVSSFYWW